jgi:hypothetical protein
VLDVFIPVVGAQGQGAHSTASRTPVKDRRSRAPLNRDFGTGCAANTSKSLSFPKSGDFVLDGELVALDSQGKPSFQLVQNNLSQALPIYFYAFDLLNRDGELLVNVGIERRRDLPGRMLPEPEDPLRLLTATARAFRTCS